MIILVKRIFVAIAGAALIAACSNVTDLSRTDVDPGQLKLNSVNVDTSNLPQVVEGRTINKTRDQLEQDLKVAVTREASAFSDPNGSPVDVNVTVNQVYLAPLAERAVAGTSFIDSTISVTGAADGTVIIPATQVVGNSDTFRAIGALGAAGALANSNVETDYQNAVNGYAKALIASLQASASQ